MTKNGRPRSDALVFFGATGDLAYKKIFPALQSMAGRGKLDLPVVGVARSGWTRDQFIERARASVTEYGGLVEENFAQAGIFQNRWGSDLLRGRIDAEGIRQVVANLVDNAIKYGPAGQPVQIGARQDRDGLRLWVEDRGPGIPAADRERVFQRFVRLDRDRGSAVSGTGIGLAVVREMVARSGGRAWIEDPGPAGTRVVILLPQPDAHGGEA